MLHIHYLEKKSIVFVPCYSWYSQAGGLDLQDQEEIKIPTVSGVSYPLAASTLLADVGWFIHGSMDTGTQIHWTTMTKALKDWNLSESTARFQNLLPSFKPAWMERHHVAALSAAGQRVWAHILTLTQGQAALMWWLPTTSAGHSPPQGTAWMWPKLHWGHQWASPSRSRCCLLYKRVW